MITIDFRFAELSYELWVLEEYLQVIETQLPRIKTQLWKQHRQQIGGLDEADADLETQERREIIEKALPRLLLNPFIVSLWAVFESAVKDIASYLQKQEGQPFGIDEIGGRFSLDKASLYLEKGVTFCFIDKGSRAWKHLKMLQRLRNAIAHANGRMEAIDHKTVNRILEWEKDSGIAIGTDGRYVYLEMGFLRQSHKVVNSVLQDLMARAKATVDAPKDP